MSRAPTRRENEAAAALLDRLCQEPGDGWVMVATLAREGLIGTSGFSDGTGTLARLVAENRVESCRRGRAWAVRSPLVVAPEPAPAPKRKREREPTVALCPDHGRRIIWRDGRCVLCVPERNL